MSRHLSANDYYSEHENVTGYWYGKGAQILGIEHEEVTPEVFEALRSNQHPLTGEKLRPRSSKVVFHDIVVSSPKSVSIAALVGQDERLVSAFEDVVNRTFDRLEALAGARERKGEACNTENVTRTGNGVAAVYHHDTSRLLEPQLHAHLVFSNHTWSEKEKRWLALQPREMMEASSKSIRQAFYRDLASECERLGYDVEWKGESFRLTAISPEMERTYSERTQQREAFTQRYTELFGQAPSKKRVEQFIKETKKPALKRFADEYRQAFGAKPTDEQITSFVKDWRTSKMARSTSEKVLLGQLKKLTRNQLQSLHTAVAQAQTKQTKRIDPNLSLETQNRAKQSEDMRLKPQATDVSAISYDEHHALHQRPRPRPRTAIRNSPDQRAIIRKMRLASALSRAMSGHPVALVSHIIRQATKQPNQNRQHQ